MTVRSNRICVGVIVGAKGIAGEVRIKNFTENPADVGAYGPVESEDGAKRWTLKVVGAARGAVTAKLTGVSDRNAAEALKGLKLFVDRAKLPDPGAGSYYHTDLVGLAVELTTGEAKGKVIAVLNFGGGDILEVGDGKTESTMVPFSNAAIAEVNMKEGFVRVVPLPGLFDDGDGSDEDMQHEGDDDNSNDNRPVKRRG
ncbi:MAG: 16S rRNA processing protein RimM [Rhodospirillaceae bacterium]|nr:16S rRNA processing protein RimM [Rhodospirillaceae bacterium]